MPRVRNKLKQGNVMNSCYIATYSIFVNVYVYSYTFAESITKEINKQVGKNWIFYTQNMAY